MPIIVPDVTPQPVPGVREQPAANETTFGGGPGLMAEGQQVQQVAKDAGDIGAFERIRADQNAVEEAGSKGLSYLTSSLYDPHTGLLMSKGKDSLTAQDQWRQNTQKTFNDIVGGLHGEAQKGAATKLLLTHYADADKVGMVHVDQQMQAHYEMTHNDLIKNQAGLVALNHDPIALAHAFDTVGNASQNFASNMHLDSDEAKIRNQQDADAVWTAHFDGLTKFATDGSPQDEFKQYKNGGTIQTAEGPVTLPPISSEAQEKIQAGLDEHGIRWQSANAAQTIMSKNPDSEADALSATEKIKNPEVQDAARKLITARFSENRAAVKNDQDDLFMRMSTMVNQKGLTDSVDRRNAVPPMAWDKLSSEQQRAIEKGGTPDATSISKWEDFNQAIKNGTLKDMSKADLNSKYIPYFDATDAKTAVDLWSGTKKPGGNPKEKSYLSVQQMIDDSLTGVGALNAKNPSRTQLTFKKEMSDSVNRDLDLQQTSLGRPLKQDEIQKVVDQHTLKALDTQSGNWFPSVPYEKIPDMDRQHIIEMARNVGITATKGHIEDAYKMHKQGKTDEQIAKALR